jgi:hypothetical protein
MAFSPAAARKITFNFFRAGRKRPARKKKKFPAALPKAKSAGYG